MDDFQLPADLTYNRGLIEDPVAYANAAHVASWLFLVGEEFASMPGGISFAQVEEAVPHSARVVSDPPRELTLELARQQVEALDALPRPTLISCRTGPRASAVAFLYAALKSGASFDAVLAAAAADHAPFLANADYQRWIESSLAALRIELNAPRVDRATTDTLQDT